jgi:hypothetical protein
MHSMTLIHRPEWELPGMGIADHSTSPPVDWSKVTNVTVHYPGGGTWPVNPTREWVIMHLRSQQASYVRTRGYSYGYNEVCAQNGIQAEVRGEGFRCAANGSTKTNTPSYAIQVIANVGSLAEALAVEGVNERIACAERMAGRKLTILGHRDHKATACPGDEIYSQIQAGAFFAADRPEIPVPPTPPESDDMAVYFVQPGNSPWSVAAFAYGDGSRYPEILAANEEDDRMDPGDLFDVPGIPGSVVTVEKGDGGYSLVRKAGQEPTNKNVADFHAWNGGVDRVLYAGDLVFVKDAA